MVSYCWLVLLVVYVGNLHFIPTSVAHAVGPSVIALSSTDFFLPKPGFLEFIWVFSGRNPLQINISHILNPNLTNSIPLKSCLSRSFPTTPKAHSNSSQIFQLWFNLIFSEKIIQYSRNFCTTCPNIVEPKPMHPSLLI